MTGLLALLCGVLAVAWCAPPVLHRLLEHGVAPRSVLAMWAMLVGASFLTVAGTLFVALTPAHDTLPRILQLLHHCWTSLRHGTAPQAHELAAALILIALAGVVFLTGRGLLRHLRQQRRLHRRHVQTLRGIARSETGPFPTMWLPHAEPLAYSVAGKPGFVVASDGLRDRLPAVDAAAVLEHERAHLRGRHHLLVGIAEALAASARWVPLLRRSPSLVRTAVELAADRVAARAHGTAAVRSALLTMSHSAGAYRSPPYSLGMAQQCLALRLRHLQIPQSAKRNLGQRVLAPGFAALVGFTLPVLSGATFLLAAAVTVCSSLFGG